MHANDAVFLYVFVRLRHNADLTETIIYIYIYIYTEQLLIFYVNFYVMKVKSKSTSR